MLSPFLRPDVHGLVLSCSTLLSVILRKLGNHPEKRQKHQKAAKHLCWGLAQLLTSLVRSLGAWPQKMQLFKCTSA